MTPAIAPFRAPARGTVLVVDDSVEIRELTELLLRDAGYNVMGADDAEEALAAAALNRADLGLVLSDINLPGMSGVELSLRLRREYPEIPVLLVSGAPARVPEGVEFLQKPYGLMDLLNRVRKCCQSSRAESSSSAIRPDWS